MSCIAAACFAYWPTTWWWPGCCCRRPTCCSLFADGIHEDLLTRLSRLGFLRVISRTSVQGYRDTGRNARSIGDELGAGLIVEGVVRVLGEQLRMSAQLIDARTDAVLWITCTPRPTPCITC